MFENFGNENFADLDMQVVEYLAGRGEETKDAIIKKIKADELCGLISNEEANMLLDKIMNGASRNFKEAEIKEEKGFYDENYKQEKQQYDFDEGETDEEEIDEGFMGLFEDNTEKDSFDFEEDQYDEGEDEDEEGFESLLG